MGGAELRGNDSHTLFNKRFNYDPRTGNTALPPIEKPLGEHVAGDRASDGRVFHQVPLCVVLPFGRLFVPGPLYSECHGARRRQPLFRHACAVQSELECGRSLDSDRGALHGIGPQGAPLRQAESLLRFYGKYRDERLAAADDELFVADLPRIYEPEPFGRNDFFGAQSESGVGRRSTT